jgi:DNA polymerase-3 subunit gamma/tau
VVGQEHIVRTLSHAVERDKVHHAYLFVGSRGTGKTSMAKILASCLNCEGNPPTASATPTITPCGVCDSCVSIASATSMDVIEMDAASNNSVDDIRELRETVAYAPVSGRHKVYILDEAHMLSSQAWNAFLKTLEEPPPNTVFVLATTEAQKVLPTVVDRCHRFDFGRPAADQIAVLLRRIAAKEFIDLQDGAAALVARHATGSYRDALGTLEQLVDYAGDEPITPADVMAVLGVADQEQLFNAVEAIIARDPGRALAAAATLSASGRDPGQVLRDLESHARELLTVQVIGSVPPELAVTRDRDAHLVQQAGALARTDAVRLLDLISGALDAAGNGAQSRIQLELVLIRAAAPEFDPSVAALLSRIERLEQGGAVRAVTAPAPVEPSPPTAAPGPPRLASAPDVDGPDTDAGAGAASDGDPGPDEFGEAAPHAAGIAPEQLCAPAVAGSSDLIQIQELWPAVIELVRGQNELLAALLFGTRPAAITERELTLVLPSDALFQKHKLESNEHHRKMAIDAVRSVTGASLELSYRLAEPVAAETRTAVEDGDKLSETALVARFVEEFDAQELKDQENS